MSKVRKEYMLSDLIPLKIPIAIGNKNFYLRYSLLSELYLEQQKLSRSEITDRDLFSLSNEEITHLLRAGLLDFYRKENKQFVEEFEFDRMKPSFEEVFTLIDFENKEILMLQIIQAIIKSLPIPPVGGTSESASSPSKKGIDYAWFRCLFVDILHQSDMNFWNSTLREIFDRYDMYATAKGYKEKVEEVQQYDDEGVN